MKRLQKQTDGALFIVTWDNDRNGRLQIRLDWVSPFSNTRHQTISPFAAAGEMVSFVKMITFPQFNHKLESFVGIGF